MHPPPATPLFFGIAGWSYPDWTNIVYPPGTKDKLAYISRYVDMIEINTTFYRPPNAKTTESWLRRTEELPDFFFSAKLHNDITHRGQLYANMIRDFYEGLAPLASAGKLKHLLAQFRYDFDAVPDNRNYLEKIYEAFSGLAHLTFELRHNSWQAPQALDFLGSLGATVANLDYPTARDSFNLHVCEVGGDRYLRLHGRNRAAWFDAKSGRDDTYNYLYPHNELGEIKERILKIAKTARSLTVVANNHYEGKEVANALQLKTMTIGRPVPFPEGIVAKYPEMKEFADAS